MTQVLRIALCALVLTGCAAPGLQAAPSGEPSAAPLSQPFLLSTHCGILWTSFAGRTFYLEELYPARVRGLPNSVAAGMTLVSPHIAEFQDRSGNRIRFVDQLPGDLNTPYPFQVRVDSGGNHLADEPFAGRTWRTSETLPGIAGPAYGNGMDAFTFVTGVFTILDAEDAVFTSDAGAVVRFSAKPPPSGCD